MVIQFPYIFQGKFDNFQMVLTKRAHNRACPGVEPEQAGQFRNGIFIIDLLKTGGLIPVCHNFVMDGLSISVAFRIIFQV